MSIHYSGSVLAFIGDAVISLHVRDYLIKKGYTKAKDLQKLSIKYVSAKGQAEFMEYLIREDLLSDEELIIYKRGRNANTGAVAKNVSVVLYRIASGFEALIGYLYYNDQKRQVELLEMLVNYF